jgi:hypothetical protein
MPKPRRQHYIPVSYLTRFAEAGKIYVHDLVKRKRYRTTIQNVANIRDFYSLEIDDKSKEVFVEEYFAEIEGKANNVINDYIKTMNKPTGQEWALLAEFIAVMHLRVPEFRKKHLEMSQYMADLLNHLSFSTEERYKKSCEQFYKGTGKKLDMPYGKMKEIVEKPERLRLILHQNEYMRSMLGIIPKIAEIAFCMTPLLLIANGKSRFITSDNPVILMDSNRNKPKFYGSGWLTKSIEVYFPLSPFTCLVLHWEGEPQVLPASNQAVSIANSCTAYYATRYIFSEMKEVFWHKNGKIICDERLLYDEFSGEKTELSSTISGPIPQTRRPFELGLIKKSAMKGSKQ